MSDIVMSRKQFKKQLEWTKSKAKYKVLIRLKKYIEDELTEIVYKKKENIKGRTLGDCLELSTDLAPQIRAYYKHKKQVR
jgi:hypothetical protein